MKKNQLERLEYEKPEVKVLPMIGESQMQSTSVNIKMPGSTEEGWGEEEDIDGGEDEI